ncbi:MAG: hypothetical protein AAGA10_13315 [Bacteroidota bacterium]
MKISTFILSMYVLFLASMPALSIVEVFPELICCSTDHDEHPEEEGDGCSEVCNPFLSCQCCPGFTTAVFEPTHRFLHPTSNNRIVNRIPSPVVSPIWHPPRA